ncbi:hypothetical protein GCM10027093_49930 [Paraburkholderia jirisanensis]
MKKPFVRAVLAPLLTLPIFLGITRMPWFWAWFNDGSGWDMLAPILKMLGAIGAEDDENVLFGLVLAVSFMISLIISTTCAAAINRLRR